MFKIHPLSLHNHESEISDIKAYGYPKGHRVLAEILYVLYKKRKNSSMQEANRMPINSDAKVSVNAGRGT